MMLLQIFEAKRYLDLLRVSYVSLKMPCDSFSDFGFLIDELSELELRAINRARRLGVIEIWKTLQNFDIRTRPNFLRVLDVHKEIVRDSEYCLGFCSGRNFSARVY